MAKFEANQEGKMTLTSFIANCAEHLMNKSDVRRSIHFDMIASYSERVEQENKKNLPKLI
jgi:hypothetical protein